MECPTCKRPLAVARPRCAYCGAAVEAIAPSSAGRLVPPRRRGRAGAWVALFVGRGTAPALDAPLAALLADAHAARQMRSRSHATVLRFKNAEDAREMLGRARATGVPAVAFADEALDALPPAEDATTITALERDGAPTLVATTTDGERELRVDELGLVVVGRVMEDGPVSRETAPDPRPARLYGGGLAGAAIGIALAAARGEPASRGVTPERRLAIDLHAGNRPALRVVEGATRATGPDFPAMPAHAMLLALFHWLESRTPPPPIDRGYDEEVRFTELARPDSRLGFDLYSARARVVESLRVKHGL